MTERINDLETYLVQFLQLLEFASVLWPVRIVWFRFNWKSTAESWELAGGQLSNTSQVLEIILKLSVIEEVTQ